MFPSFAHGLDFDYQAHRYRIIGRAYVAPSRVDGPLQFAGGRFEVVPEHLAATTVQHMMMSHPLARARFGHFCRFLGLPAADHRTDGLLRDLLGELRHFTGSVVLLRSLDNQERAYEAPPKPEWKRLAPAEPDRTPEHYVEFSVLDQLDVPYQGVPLLLELTGAAEERTKLDAQGHLLRERVQAGSHRATFALPAEEPPPLHTGWLTFVATDTTGRPLTGVAFTVRGNGIERSGTLDTEGRGVVTGVPDGDYEVSFGSAAVSLADGE